MTLEVLRQAVIDEANDFYFEYDGLRAGVEFTAENGIFFFNAWYGDKEKKYGATTFEQVVHDKFFKGKSVAELLAKNVIDIEFA